MLFLVRHAEAGVRADWHDDDRTRPLTERGQAQADAIADRLAPLLTGSLVSSPYVRCVQTLLPLGVRTDRTVDTDERLAEESTFDGVLELLRSLPDGSALCSHGDVIPDTIAALERRGCRFDSAPDWRKGSVWVLHRDDAHVVAATAWPPPDA